MIAEVTTAGKALAAAAAVVRKELTLVKLTPDVSARLRAALARLDSAVDLLRIAWKEVGEYVCLADRVDIPPKKKGKKDEGKN